MLTPNTLYQLSDKMGEVARTLKAAHKNLFELNLLRYKYFVDGSSVGHDCMFAKTSAQFVKDDNELQVIETELNRIVSEIGKALGEIKHVRRLNS